MFCKYAYCSSIFIVHTFNASYSNFSIHSFSFFPSKNEYKYICFWYNHANLLPDDVMKIINKKIQDLQIIKRRTERK